MTINWIWNLILTNEMNDLLSKNKSGAIQLSKYIKLMEKQKWLRNQKKIKLLSISEMTTGTLYFICCLELDRVFTQLCMSLFTSSQTESSRVNTGTN